MGKATIISDIGDGQYEIEILYASDRKAANIAQLDEQIASLTEKWEALGSGLSADALQLQITALEKRKEYIQNNFPENDRRTVWCADHTEGLTGEVATIEVPGELGTALIAPGYDGNAAWTLADHGKLNPTLNLTPSALFVNWAILPGWQKFHPTYRFGTITAMDGETCSVTLDAVESSAQALNINQRNQLSGVPFSYMNCDHRAFDVGDDVVVKFEGQSWDNPVVIGFRHDPAVCSWLEAWCGPEIASAHAWSREIRGYKVSGEAVFPNNSSFALTPCADGCGQDCGHVVFSATPTTVGQGWIEYYHAWSVEAGEEPLHSGAEALVCNVEFDTYDCASGSSSDPYRLGELYIEAEKDGSPIYFEIFFLNTTNYFAYPQIGCTGLSEEVDWFEAYGAWVCAIDRERSNEILLPVSGVDITKISLYFEEGCTFVVNGIPPNQLRGFSDIQINYIEVI